MYNGLILNYNSLLKKGFTKNNPRSAGNKYSTKDINIPKLSKDCAEANSEKNSIISPSLTPNPAILTGIILMIIIIGNINIISEKGILKLIAFDNM